MIDLLATNLGLRLTTEPHSLLILGASLALKIVEPKRGYSKAFPICTEYYFAQRIIALYWWDEKAPMPKVSLARALASV